eukprot:7143981-Heterocapsa_arctica.AAC.1
MISAPRLRDLSHLSGIGTSRRNRMTRRTSLEADPASRSRDLGHTRSPPRTLPTRRREPRGASE